MTATPKPADSLQARTIRDFGEQWTTYTDNSGYYGSAALFDDAFAPFISVADLKDTRIAEIGAGTGRFIAIFLAAGAAHVRAVEPSAAMDVIRRVFAAPPETPSRLELVQAPGECLAQDGSRDFVFSIGVLHHIPDPDPVCRAAFGALRPGGRFGAWLYGREGNGAYLFVFGLLHGVTRRLPHQALAILSWCLGWALDRVLPLPLRGYARNVLAKLTRDKRRLVIYDQLNPAYARYYRRDEAVDLLHRAGFVDIQVNHRHGYSWTVVGRKPRT
jgi:SAM-dependent methyltransferase